MAEWATTEPSASRDADDDEVITSRTISAASISFTPPSSACSVLQCRHHAWPRRPPSDALPSRAQRRPPRAEPRPSRRAPSRPRHREHFAEQGRERPDRGRRASRLPELPSVRANMLHDVRRRATSCEGPTGLDRHRLVRPELGVGPRPGCTPRARVRAPEESRWPAGSCLTPEETPRQRARGCRWLCWSRAVAGCGDRC